MSRFFVLLLSFIALAITSCDDTEAVTDAETKVALTASDTLSIPTLKGLKPKLTLTSDAAKAIKDWTLYNDLQVAVDSLEATKMGDLKPRIASLVGVFEKQEEAEEAAAPVTPATVETKAIQSRLLAIQTQINILRNNSERNVPDVDEVAQAMVKVKNGFQNLNLQLNERFTISIKDLLEEIKNEKDETSFIPTTVQPSGKPQLQYRLK